MKIFSVSQIRAWDDFTITNEPISSLDLMERASIAFVKWFCERFDDRQCVKILCGMGNNGGDGWRLDACYSKTLQCTGICSKTQ
jgi:NAD(P)H-hydrate repair Nnr-like enzyme with NAD(P)H-hydrate epimerase domain